MLMKKSRPLGISIMAIITAISAVLSFLAGLAAFGIGVWTLTLGPSMWGVYAGIVGIITIAWGLLGFSVAGGLWSLKNWAWTWAVLWQIIDLVLAVVDLRPLTTLLALIIIVYLLAKKDYFSE
jgi:hypothetical protein